MLKKKIEIIFVLMLPLLSLTSFAQQKKVAVYVTGQQTDINKVLGDKLVEAFAKSGKYMAIERTSSFLAELSKEQNYQRTGAVDDNEVSRIGKQFGVQLVCVADISEAFGQKYVSARLIDVETAEIINVTNMSSQLNSMEELKRVSNIIATELTTKTAQENTLSEYNISYSEFRYRISDFYKYPTTGYLLEKSDELINAGHWLLYLTVLGGLGAGLGIGLPLYLDLGYSPGMTCAITIPVVVALCIPQIVCYSVGASYKKKAWRAYREPYDNAMKQLKNERRVSMRITPSGGYNWAGVGVSMTF